MFPSVVREKDVITEEESGRCDIWGLLELKMKEGDYESWNEAACRNPNWPSAYS